MPEPFQPDPGKFYALANFFTETETGWLLVLAICFILADILIRWKKKN